LIRSQKEGQNESEKTTDIHIHADFEGSTVWILQQARIFVIITVALQTPPSKTKIKMVQKSSCTMK